jgi:hypothetical protein
VDLTVAAFAVAVGIIIFGSVVQGTIGFGLGLLAAPFIAIVIPDAIPVTLVLVAWPIGGVTALRHRARASLPWMLAGTVPDRDRTRDHPRRDAGCAGRDRRSRRSSVSWRRSDATRPRRLNHATTAGFIGNVTGTQHRSVRPSRCCSHQPDGAGDARRLRVSDAVGDQLRDHQRHHPRPFLLALALLPAMLLGVGDRLPRPGRQGLAR